MCVYWMMMRKLVLGTNVELQPCSVLVTLVSKLSLSISLSIYIYLTLLSLCLTAKFLSFQLFVMIMLCI